MICLDTNIVIAAINQRAAAVRQRLMKTLHEGTIVGIPTVVLYKLWYGIKKSARAQANTDALDNFLALDDHVHGHLNRKTPKRPAIFVLRWSV